MNITNIIICVFVVGISFMLFRYVYDVLRPYRNTYGTNGGMADMMIGTFAIILLYANIRFIGAML